MNFLIPLTMIQMLSLLFFGLKYSMKVDMLLNKETRQKSKHKFSLDESTLYVFSIYSKGLFCMT